jgi:hypothetical protein
MRKNRHVKLTTYNLVTSDTREKRLDIQGRKPNVEPETKKAENRSHSHENQATKGNNLLPLS